MSDSTAHEARSKRRFTFVVVDSANDDDSVYSRVKQMMKTMLRAYRLRCIEHREDRAEVQQ